MGIIETITTGLSIISGVKDLYDWVMGNTVMERLEKISAKIDKIGDHLFFLPQQEVWDTRVTKQETVEDIRQVKEIASHMQQAIGTDVIVSKPIVAPSRLRKSFEGNPEEILFSIQPLKGKGIPNEYMQDPTMIPVIFSRCGQYFVGLIKMGYVRDYWDCEYKPQTCIVSSSVAAPSVALVAATHLGYNRDSYLKIIQRRHRHG